MGIKNVAVLEQNYIGSGAAGRNTTILRSNYKTPEGARFYDASVKMYEQLSKELDFNLLFSQCGHLTLAHSDRAMFVMANRAEVNRLNGIDSRLVDAAEVARLCPQLNVSEDVTYPIMGALYHPPGGIIRHDAVVWGYARAADRGGVEIHPYTKVEGFERTNGRIDAVKTNRGTVKAGQVISAVAGWSTLVCDMANVELPITTHILQACVTEPVKPLLDVVIVSSQMHVYISQSDRGRVRHGLRDRAVDHLPDAGDAQLPPGPHAPHARAVPAARASPAPARVGGAVRPVARLQPDPGARRRSRTSTSAPAGARTASRRRQSSARRWPSSCTAAARPS